MMTEVRMPHRDVMHAAMAERGMAIAVMRKVSPMAKAAVMKISAMKAAAKASSVEASAVKAAGKRHSG